MIYLSFIFLRPSILSIVLGEADHYTHAPFNVIEGWNWIIQ